MWEALSLFGIILPPEMMDEWIWHAAAPEINGTK